MTNHEPKDYRLAKRAYEAYHQEQPQIWFEDLSHDYQMRWVNAIREVLKEADIGKLRGAAKKITVSLNPTERIRRDPDPITSVDAAETILRHIPRNKFGRIVYKGMPERRKRRIKNALRYLAMHKR